MKFIKFVLKGILIIIFLVGSWYVCNSIFCRISFIGYLGLAATIIGFQGMYEWCEEKLEILIKNYFKL